MSHPQRDSRRSIVVPAARHRTAAPKRRGAATLWLILFFPIILILLVTVAEVGHLLLARQQVKNSLESAATAAAAEWGRTGGVNSLAARDRAVQFGGLNYINRAQPVTLAPNYTAASGHPNQNAQFNGATANLIFGRVTGPANDLLLDANTTPTASDATARAIATGRFGNNTRNDDFLRFEFSAALSPATVIREVWIDLRSGTEPGNNAFFVYPPSAWGTQTSSAPPTTPATITFHTAMPPTTGNRVTVNAPVIRIVLPAANFTAGSVGAPNFLRLNGVRVRSLGAGATANTGDAFGIYGIQGRFVTQAAPPGGPTAVQPFTFQNTGGTNLISQQAITIPDLGSLFGVRAATTVQVPSLTSSLFGFSWGAFTVRAESSAAYDRSATAGQVRVVRIQRYDPPSIAVSP
ncbi:MAG: TadE family protein [Pirellulales bacterium]